MAVTSSSPERSAPKAAICPIVGAHSIVYWWTFVIASSISPGAAAYPILHPVIAYALEKPPRRMQLSLAPGKLEKQVCSTPYTSLAYTSSEMTTMPLRWATSAMAVSSVLLNTAPVGLAGGASRQALVRGVGRA